MICYLWWLKASDRRCPQLHVPAGVPCVQHPITPLFLRPHYVFFMYFTHLHSVWRNLNVIFMFLFFFAGCENTTDYWVSLPVQCFCGGDPFVYPGTQTVKSPGSCPITFIHRRVLCHCAATLLLSAVMFRNHKPQNLRNVELRPYIQKHLEWSDQNWSSLLGFKVNPMRMEI